MSSSQLKSVVFAGREVLQAVQSDRPAQFRSLNPVPSEIGPENKTQIAVGNGVASLIKRSRSVSCTFVLSDLSFSFKVLAR